jgi:hypothetical protein
MAPKTKKKVAAKKPVAAKAPVKAATAPAAMHSHKKGEACCSCNCKIWTGVIALIIGAAAGYIVATL